MPTPPKQEKIRCPFTGKMIPKPPPRPVAILPDDDNPLTGSAATRKEELEFEMAKLRSKFVDIGPSKRCGATGTKMATQYRRLSLEYWHLTGNHPPKLDADL